MFGWSYCDKCLISLIKYPFWISLSIMACNFSYFNRVVLQCYQSSDIWIWGIFLTIEDVSSLKLLYFWSRRYVRHDFIQNICIYPILMPCLIIWFYFRWMTHEMWSTCSISQVRKVAIIQTSPVVAFKMKGQIILLKFATQKKKIRHPTPISFSSYWFIDENVNMVHLFQEVTAERVESTLATKSGDPLHIVLLTDSTGSELESQHMIGDRVRIDCLLCVWRRIPKTIRHGLGDSTTTMHGGTVHWKVFSEGPSIPQENKKSFWWGRRISAIYHSKLNMSKVHDWSPYTSLHSKFQWLLVYAPAIGQTSQVDIFRMVPRVFRLPIRSL